jgi:hypothetical protein
MNTFHTSDISDDKYQIVYEKEESIHAQLRFLQIYISFFAYLLVLHVHLAKGGVVEAKEGRVVGRDDAILRATYTHTIQSINRNI